MKQIRVLDAPTMGPLWDGNQLANWLNDTKLRMAKERISGIVSAFQTFIDLEENPPREQCECFSGGKIRLCTYHKALSDSDSAIHRLLPRNGRLLRARNNQGKSTARWAAPTFKERPFFAALNAFVFLLDNDDAMSLRRCPQKGCARWFFQYGRQKFCSYRCKEKQKRSSPAFKAKRAKYMRETWYPANVKNARKDKKTKTSRRAR